jgi:CheY-like chemotaxis protein
MSENSHIMVVEGSRTQAERLKLVLQAHGYPVTVVTDGREALVMARTQRPALIISGIAVSGMDGYDMCAALKHDTALKDIPVVLLTALTDVEDLMRGLRAKVDYYIAKPYQEDDLLSRIAAIIDGLVQQKGEPGQEQLEILLRGTRYVIVPDRQQLMRLLLSTYENYSAVLQQNRLLTTAQLQLKTRNLQLQEENKQAQAALAALRDGTLRGQETEPVPRADEATAGANGIRILVAQDNAVNRTLLARLLEKLGYQADVAANGLAAVEACARTSYAAVLLDRQMPLMDGFEATRAIREREAAQNAERGLQDNEHLSDPHHSSFIIHRSSFPHLPIIAVTVHTLSGDRERCLAAGMDDYLPKPVNLETLKATLARWLSRSASPAAMALPANKEGLGVTVTCTQAERVP